MRMSFAWNEEWLVLLRQGDSLALRTAGLVPFRASKIGNARAGGWSRLKVSRRPAVDYWPSASE